MSATMEGAEEYAQRNLAQSTMNKIIVTAGGVRALAVNSSPEYEYEKEILLPPNLVFTMQGLVTLNGQLVAVHHVRRQ